MAAIKSQYYSGFDPRQLSNCQLWLDAADLSYFTFSSGSNITIWKDKSGNAYDASAVGVPTRAAGPTGLTGVVFNGTSKFIGTQANTGTVVTGFVVADMSSTAASDARIVSLAASGTSDSGSALYTALFLRSGTAQQVRTFRNSLQMGICNVTYNTPFVGTSLFTGTSNLFYSNGAPATQVASSGNFGYTQYGLGNYPSFPPASGTQPLTGTIYEVILYNQALSSNDRQSVEGYLAWKWNLNTSLLSNHAYRRAPTVMRPLAPVDIEMPLGLVGGILQPWFDAADYTSLVLSNVTDVSQWTDRGRFARNATQSTVSNRPLYNQGRLPSISMTSPRYFNLTSMPIAPYDIFVVGTPLSTTTDWRTLFRADAGMNPVVLQTGTDNAGYWTGTAFVQFGTMTWSPGVTNLLFARMNSDKTMQASLNGTVALTAAGTAGTASEVVSFMGGLVVSGVYSNQPWGDVNEVIFYYSNALNTFQRQQVEGYLAWKWGLQAKLPVAHPFKTYNPFVVAVNPLTVSNCALWLDAADTATITTSGTNVTTWADKSGNARNATATSNWPTFTAGNNYIQFSGNNWFSYPATFLSNTQYTLFFSVARDVSKAEHVLTSSGTGNTNNTNLITGYSPNMYVFKYGYFGNDTSFNAPAFTTLPEPPTIITLQQTLLNRLAWYNGTQTLTNANSTLLASQNDGLLGVYFRSASTAWNGKWYEAIMYNRSLNANERQQVEGYLAWKWGVQRNLPIAHPFKNIRP